MHGQDANLVALAFAEIALDLDITGGDPAQEALQRGHVLALVGERQGEEFLDRVGRLGPEPLEQRLSPTTGAEDLGIKLERRHEIGASEQLAQPLECRAHRLVFPGVAAQPAPQRRLAAIIGEEKQLVLREVEKRPLEHAGQRQIILRQQQEAAERHEVLHRHLIGENQPIGPGNRHIVLLQRTQQFAHEGVAAPHQHHHITRPQCPPARLEPLAARQPLRDRGGDRASEARVRLGRARAV